jgi:hypothetical protein
MLVLGVLFVFLGYFFSFKDMFLGRFEESWNMLGTKRGSEWAERQKVYLRWDLLIGVWTSFLQVMMITAVSILVSIRFKLLPNLIICVLVFMIGHTLNHLSIYLVNTWGSWAKGLDVLFSLFPLFSQVNLNETIAIRGKEITDLSLILKTSFYAFSISGLYLSLAMRAFKNREIF